MGTSIKKVVNGNKKFSIDTIAGTLTDAEKKKLQSGEGFVKVPHEELCRQRVNVYQFLM